MKTDGFYNGLKTPQIAYVFCNPKTSPKASQMERKTLPNQICTLFFGLFFSIANLRRSV